VWTPRHLVYCLKRTAAYQRSGCSGRQEGRTGRTEGGGCSCWQICLSYANRRERGREGRKLKANEPEARNDDEGRGRRRRRRRRRRRHNRSTARGRGRTHFCICGLLQLEQLLTFEFKLKKLRFLTMSLCSVTFCCGVAIACMVHEPGGHGKHKVQLSSRAWSRQKGATFKMCKRI
jgi:hypothetical protein